jgi:hypothetical protein
VNSRAPAGDSPQPHAGYTVEGDTPTEVSRDPLAPSPRPIMRDRSQIMGGGVGLDTPPGESEDLAGKDLADAAMMVMSGFDRGQGAVPLRNVVDTLMRRGKIGGDHGVATAQVSAALRADNTRRAGLGQRPRFRLASQGRVALTEWLLSHDLVRLEQDSLAAVERYRESARRNLHRKVQELPGHAFVELTLLLLERMGMRDLRSVKRAGSPGGEAHFSAAHRTGTEEIRTAVVIRKDGREIGRERVSDLRGALHHYGPAACGWLVTTGQVLSGAREEATAAAAPPVTMMDGLTLARMLEDFEVGVVATRHVTCIPDMEFFETLRGS